MTALKRPLASLPVVRRVPRAAARRPTVVGFAVLVVARQGAITARAPLTGARAEEDHAGRGYGMARKPFTLPAASVKKPTRSPALLSPLTTVPAPGTFEASGSSISVQCDTGPVGSVSV